jgi:hypothetical protein
LNIGAAAPMAMIAPVSVGLAQSFQLNQEGASLFFATGGRISQPFIMALTKPSGSVVNVRSSSIVVGAHDISMIVNRYIVPFPGNTYVAYTIHANELDEIGIWSVHLSNLNGTPISGAGTFRVIGTVH